MSARRNRQILRLVLWLSAPLPIFGCTSESSSYPDVPGAMLWDQPWASLSTHAELSASVPVPLPTDTSLLEAIRFGEGGAPPVSDVLEGVHMVFELDGRLLAQPVGFEAAESSGTNYRIVDDRSLRFSVDKSPWFLHSYGLDSSKSSLLLSPAEAGGGALMGFVLSVVQMNLLAGDLDSAAVRVAELLLADARVEEESDRFVYDLVHGDLSEIPTEGTDDIVVWLSQLLKETGLVNDDVPSDVLDAALEPIADELLTTDSEGIAAKLAQLVLESDVPLAVSKDRAQRLLPYALYRSFLEVRGYLANVERVELVLAPEN